MNTLRGLLLIIIISIIGSIIFVSTSNAAGTYSIAKRYIGLHENKHRTQLKRYLGVDPVRVPWCSALVSTIITRSGYKRPKNHLASRSYLNWGKRISLKNIRRGDVVIFARKGGGHNGIFSHWENGKMMIISGNSSNRVRLSAYSTKNLLGVRRGVK